MNTTESKDEDSGGGGGGSGGSSGGGHSSGGSGRGGHGGHGSGHGSGHGGLGGDKELTDEELAIKIIIVTVLVLLFLSFLVYYMGFKGKATLAKRKFKKYAKDKSDNAGRGAGGSLQRTAHKEPLSNQNSFGSYSATEYMTADTNKMIQLTPESKNTTVEVAIAGPSTSGECSGACSQPNTAILNGATGGFDPSGSTELASAPLLDDLSNLTDQSSSVLPSTIARLEHKS